MSNRENESQEESFESKIEKAMAQIVNETAGPDIPTIQANAPDKAKNKPVEKTKVKSVPPHKAKQKKANAKKVVMTEEAGHRASHKKAKIIGGIAAALIAALGCTYSVFAYSYADKFFDGTYINSIDCSGMTVEEAEKAVADVVQDYAITIQSRGQEDQTITGASINYEYVSDGGIQKIKDEQGAIGWASGFFSKHEYAAAENIKYDETKLDEQISVLPAFQTENQTAPKDAYVSFQDTEFVVVPEEEGTLLDDAKAKEAVASAVSASQATISLEEAGVYQEPAQTAADPGIINEANIYNKYAKASITYTIGEHTETLNGDTIKNWLTFTPEGAVDETNTNFAPYIANYVAEVAAKYDTVGKDRTFTTHGGQQITVTGGTYGWAIDQAGEIAQLTEEIKGQQITTREPIFSKKGAVYGENDLGNSYIEVALSEQHLYYYQEGQVVMETDFVSGNMSYSDRKTPAGIFQLYYKQSPSVLRGDKKADGTYTYEENVTYWMPFNNGIGFHDAPWRYYFGGSIYKTNGSHGCINLPYSSAEQLYSIINTSVPIILYY